MTDIPKPVTQDFLDGNDLADTREICRMCGGEGTVTVDVCCGYGHYNFVPEECCGRPFQELERCHRCNGRGWCWAGDQPPPPQQRNRW